MTRPNDDEPDLDAPVPPLPEVSPPKISQMAPLHRAILGDEAMRLLWNAYDMLLETRDYPEFCAKVEEFMTRARTKCQG